MLLNRALVIVKSRDDKVARSKFINVRVEEHTMVARFPQQVLLLLILVTGTSMGSTKATEDPEWKRNRSLRTASSASSTKKYIENTTAASSPGRRLDFDLFHSKTDVAEHVETSRPSEIASEHRHDVNHPFPTSSNPFESKETLDTSPTDNRILFQSIFDRSSPSPSFRYDRPALSDHNFRVTPNQSTKVSFAKLSSELTTDVTLPRRQMRESPDACDQFEIGDDAKMEFYSPNYPNDYPPSIDCVRILKVDEGMIIKLDFRDTFRLEDQECRYDYLEVRDGQYGFSPLLGKYCGTKFPPELTSHTRYLWLHFHSDENIEHKGFRALWQSIPRPTDSGVAPEQEPCIYNITEEAEKIIKSSDIMERKLLAERDKVPLDCLWVIKVWKKWRIQLAIPKFHLRKPNDCDANFVEVYQDKTEMSSIIKKFCGSIADVVVSGKNVMYLRYYADLSAINSTFEGFVTAFRDKESSEKNCKENEFDCQDTTCISKGLTCNRRFNCRFRWDEEENMCGSKKGSLMMDSEHIIIILVVFSLIMFGMCFAFLFNCVRKLIRDHRIIQEHIRQSRENRLDELGRKSTPCPISTSRTDIRDRGSESPSLEVVPSKELLPPSTIIAHEYKELVLEMKYNGKDMNDIHQSNNVSNATQERLQESSEEPEMRDNSCQTRDSLFESHGQSESQPSFITFGFHPSQNGSSRCQSSSKSKTASQQTSQCSGCSPVTNISCPRHTPIPAPPGWSMHETYPSVIPVSQHPEASDYPTYQRFQSPKPAREPTGYRQSPNFGRQTAGSRERYGSSVYGSGHGSTNTSSSPHSASSKYQASDPRYRAEAVIEIDQNRPFSIESTKSAPDVIATH